MPGGRRSTTTARLAARRSRRRVQRRCSTTRRRGCKGPPCRPEPSAHPRSRSANQTATEGHAGSQPCSHRIPTETDRGRLARFAASARPRAMRSVWTVGVAQRCGDNRWPRFLVLRGCATGDRPAGAGFGAGRCGASQALATANWCLWSFIRLCVAVISRHSECAAALPRRWNWSMPRLCFVWANTGSIIALRFR